MRLRRSLLTTCLLITLLVVPLMAQETTPEATAEATEIGTASAPTATNTPSNASHKVERGDTLYSIARRYGTSVNTIAQLNGITNTNTIFVGQVLFLPATTATPTPTVTPTSQPTTPTATSVPATPTTAPSSNTYVVQVGDTLFRIALRNKTTVAELLKLNNISNQNIIYVGQKLFLPDGASAVTTPTTTAQPASATPLSTTSALNVPFERGIEVFVEGIDLNTLVSQVDSLNVGWVKLTLNWREVEAVKGTLTLDTYDAAINALSATGVKIMLTLTGAPNWARPSATPFVLENLKFSYGPPDKAEDFGTFASKIAERYKGKVQAYEIWVEPNLRRSWIDAKTTGADNVKLSNVSYVALLRASYTAIKKVDSTALVITAGLAPTSFDDIRNSIPDRKFLQEMIKQGALSVSDAIGIEPDGFANPPDAQCCAASDGVLTHFDNKQFFFLDTVKDYRDILSKNGGADKPLWITRFGWGTSNGNSIVSPNMNENPYYTYTDPNEQATYTMRALELGDELGYIGTMFVYNLNGCSVNNGEACFYSLIASDGSERPLGTALGLTPQSNALPLEDPTPTPQN